MTDELFRAYAELGEEVLKHLDVSDDFIAHRGVMGMSWYKHRFGEWQNHAKYAAGRARYAGESDPEPIDHHTTDEDEATIRKRRNRLRTAAVLNALALNPVKTAQLTKLLIEEKQGLKKEQALENERAENTNIDKKSGFKLKDREMTREEDLARVNPGYKNLQLNTKNNCMLCTVTYDLRRRGYDVTANKAAAGYGLEDLRRWYPDVEKQAKARMYPFEDSRFKRSLVADTLKNIAAQGDGARGGLLLTLGTKRGIAGHAVAYEVVNGKVKILDGQSNKIYDNPERLLRSCCHTIYVRLDNIEPDLKEVKECARS